jgi:hypothetical protein
MDTSRIRSFSAIGACTVSLLSAIYAGVLFSRGEFLSGDLATLHQLLLSLMLATWFVADSHVQKRFSPSFDHGWFVCLALPIYAPYHLISTRRWRGLAICAGMFALFLLPFIAEIIVYYVS